MGPENLHLNQVQLILMVQGLKFENHWSREKCLHLGSELEVVLSLCLKVFNLVNIISLYKSSRSIIGYHSTSLILQCLFSHFKKEGRGEQRREAQRKKLGSSVVEPEAQGEKLAGL